MKSRTNACELKNQMILQNYTNEWNGMIYFEYEAEEGAKQKRCNVYKQCLLYYRQPDGNYIFTF